MSLGKIALLLVAVAVVVAASTFGWGTIGVNEPVTYSLPFEDGPYGGVIADVISCVIFGVKFAFWLAVTVAVSLIAILIMFGVNVAIEIVRKICLGLGYMASSVKGTTDKPQKATTITTVEAIKLLEERVSRLEKDQNE